MSKEAVRAIELQGVMTALHVLRVMTTELQAIAAELDQKLAQLPAWFAGAPVLIDPSAIDGQRGSSRLRLLPLVDLLRTRGLVPVAVRAGTPARMEEARQAGLGVLEWDRASAAKRAQREAAAAAPVEIIAPGSELQSAQLLSQPLRAGQIVYAEGRDAIALSAVNTGAELIADGNIHVYAPLRGRALAGANGNDQARIFCQRLEAELVSIAGVYVSADDLPADMRGKAVQISLRDGALVIAELAAR